jgi:hypothetical protein
VSEIIQLRLTLNVSNNDSAEIESYRPAGQKPKKWKTRMPGAYVAKQKRKVEAVAISAYDFSQISFHVSSDHGMFHLTQVASYLT